MIAEKINKLVQHPGDKKTLPTLVQRQSINARLGKSGFSDQDSGGTGIASPLTVISKEVVDIEVFDDFNVWSVIEKHTVKMTTKDAQGREVVIIDPTVEAEQ